MEVGEHLGASDHNIVCAKILLRVRVQESRVRPLDFRKANLEWTCWVCDKDELIRFW